MSEWVKEFLERVSPQFYLVGGKLFPVWSRRQLRDFRRMANKRSLSTGDENTANYLFFNYPIGETLETRIASNHRLAECTCLAWRALIDSSFPQLHYTLFASNEYIAVFEDEASEPVSEEIRASVRLWTFDPETHDGMIETYRPEQAGPEKVFWRERRESGLFELSEMLRFIRLPRGSVEKQRTFARFHKPGDRVQRVEL